jgi:16S rRNA (adenine1518-N6/adenine1519-N6)-dimethyltransferase
MKKVTYLLEKYNLAPLNILSQNFLLCEDVMEMMAGYAKKTTLEIGPGLGFLTEKISKKADKVIAVEKDRGMIKVLNNEYNFKNVEIHHEDFLKTDFSFDCCVSSIPYSISSKIIFKLLEKDHEYSVLLLQKEYTEKMIQMKSRLGIMINALADIEIIDSVNRKCFYPSPKVDSLIVKLTPNRKVKNPFFSKTVRVLFQHKRKKVINALIDSSGELNVEKKQARNIFSGIDYSEERVFKLDLEKIEKISESLEKILKNRNRENAA